MDQAANSKRDYFGAPPHLRDSPEQARCDAIQAAFRDGDAPRSIRRDPPPLPPPLVPSDDPLRLRLAEELDYARRMIDSLGDELASDMAVVMRHSVALQSIDIAGQMLGHIANVVRAQEPDVAVSRIGMCELKSRLTRSGRL